MEQNKNYQALSVVISQCTTQLNSISLQQQEFYTQRRNVEEHFERCIHSLEARRIDLLHQFDVQMCEKIEAIQTKLSTHISICKDILKTGSNVFSTSNTFADSIWQGALNLETPTTNDSLSIDIDLPDILDMISVHGSVAQKSPIPTTLVHQVTPVPIPAPTNSDITTTQIVPPNFKFSSMIPKEAVVSTFAVTENRKDDKQNDTVLGEPWGMCYNPLDRCLYVSDYRGNAIKRVTLQGEINTFVRFIANPTGIAFDNESIFYVANSTANTITKITSKGVASIFAGSNKKGNSDGIGNQASFNNPADIAIDPQTGNLYVCDLENHAIRVVSPKRQVSTLAGSRKGFADGHQDNAMFNTPCGIAFDTTEQSLIVCDNGNNKLRRVKLDGHVSTLCEVPAPVKISIAPDNTIIVSSYVDKVFIVSISGGTCSVTPLAGSGAKGKCDGKLLESTFHCPQGIVVRGSSIFVAEYNNHAIRRIKLESPTSGSSL